MMLKDKVERTEPMTVQEQIDAKVKPAKGFSDAVIAKMVKASEDSEREVVCPNCGTVLRDVTPDRPRALYRCDCSDYVREHKLPLIIPTTYYSFNKACFGCKYFDACGDIDREVPCKGYEKE